MTVRVSGTQTLGQETWTPHLEPLFSLPIGQEEALRCGDGSGLRAQDVSRLRKSIPED